MRHFSTALRRYVPKRIEEIREADILVGTPCCNNEDTLPHGVQSVSRGICIAIGTGRGTPTATRSR